MEMKGLILPVVPPASELSRHDTARAQ